MLPLLISKMFKYLFYRCQLSDLSFAPDFKASLHVPPRHVRFQKPREVPTLVTMVIFVCLFSPTLPVSLVCVGNVRLRNRNKYDTFLVFQLFKGSRIGLILPSILNSLLSQGLTTKFWTRVLSHFSLQFCVEFLLHN